MKKVLIFFVVLCLSCNNKEEKILELEVVKTIEGFFEVLDVNNKDKNLLNKYVTQDFLIYEAGKKMNKSEFIEFISDTQAHESNWELSDFKISVNGNSAHTSLTNKGKFIVKNDSIKVRYTIDWLESAYLVKEDNNLKIKFYFSDNIGTKIDTIN